MRRHASSASKMTPSLVTVSGSLAVELRTLSMVSLFEKNKVKSKDNMMIMMAEVAGDGNLTYFRLIIIYYALVIAHLYSLELRSDVSEKRIGGMYKWENAYHKHVRYQTALE
jgi:hypothetical protein